MKGERVMQIRGKALNSFCTKASAEASLERGTQIWNGERCQHAEKMMSGMHHHTKRHDAEIPLMLKHGAPQNVLDMQLFCQLRT